VRAYKDKPVPGELLHRVLEAARWAPNGANLQPWHFVVVRDREGREFISRHSRFFFVQNRHISEAPVAIILCGDPRRSKWFQYDCTLAGANIMLTAHSLGLGSCWIGVFEAEAIKERFGIPPEMEIVGIIILGYPDEKPSAPTRLPLEKVVHFEAFDKSRAAGAIERNIKSGPLTVLGKVLKLIFKR